MKNTNESLAKLSKIEVIAIALELEAKSQPPVIFRDTPEIPAVPAVVENGITTTPEIPAVPAKSVRAQLLALAPAYTTDCEKIEAENAAGLAAFTSSPAYIEVSTAKTNAEKFRTENAAAIAELENLQTALIAVNAKMTVRGANLKSIRTERIAIEEKMDAIDAGITYPSDYEKSFDELPTFTPAEMPNIDTYFPNGITGNFQASFFLGARKNSAPKTNSEKSAYSSLTTFEKQNICRKVVAAMEAGKSLKDAKETVAIAHPELLTAPASTFPNVLHNIKWGRGQAANVGTAKSITVANYDKTLNR